MTQSHTIIATNPDFIQIRTRFALWFVPAFAVAVLLNFTLFECPGGFFDNLPILAVAGFGGLAVFFYVKRTENKAASHFVVLMYVFLTEILIFSLAEKHIGTTHLFFLLYPITAAVLTGRRSGLLHSIGFLFLLAAVAFVFRTAFTELLDKSPAVEIFQYITFCLMLTFVSYIIERQYFIFIKTIAEFSQNQLSIHETDVLHIEELEVSYQKVRDELNAISSELDIQNRINDQFVKLNLKFENQQRELMSYNAQLEDEKSKTKTLLHNLQQQNEEINTINTELKTKQEIIHKQNEELIHTLEVIHNQQNKISSINKDIRDSLHYAKTIQEAMLPSRAILDTLFDEYFLMFEPKELVGGDFYYAAKVNNHLIFAVADCTGHGIPGGFMSMLGISFLHQIISKMMADSTGAMLDMMRNRIKEIFKKAESYNYNGLDIALCAIDLNNGIMQFSGAFSPLILIRDENEIEYKATRNPIGVYPAEVSFTTEYIQLYPDDRIYLFSDGFADQIGHNTQKKLGSKNFKNSLFSLHSLPFDQQKKVYQKTFRDWKGQNEQTDDITVLGVHWKPKKNIESETDFRFSD